MRGRGDLDSFSVPDRRGCVVTSCSNEIYAGYHSRKTFTCHTEVARSRSEHGARKQEKSNLSGQGIEKLLHGHGTDEQAVLSGRIGAGQPLTRGRIIHADPKLVRARRGVGWQRQKMLIGQQLARLPNASSACNRRPGRYHAD